VSRRAALEIRKLKLSNPSGLKSFLRKSYQFLKVAGKIKNILRVNEKAQISIKANS
jgi:hypothetical protein